METSASQEAARKMRAAFYDTPPRERTIDHYIKYLTNGLSYNNIVSLAWLLDMVPNGLRQDVILEANARAMQLLVSQDFLHSATYKNAGGKNRRELLRFMKNNGIAAIFEIDSFLSRHGE